MAVAKRKIIRVQDDMRDMKADIEQRLPPKPGLSVTIESVVKSLTGLTTCMEKLRKTSSMAAMLGGSASELKTRVDEIDQVAHHADAHELAAKLFLQKNKGFVC